MRAVRYQRAADAQTAIGAATDNSAYLGGGTTLLDLAKLGVLAPDSLIDISGLARDHGTIIETGARITFGAMVTMAEAERNAAVRLRYPVIADALRLAASPQIRNMARLGGNLLQRTRCAYYRDPVWAQCNRRRPGSGCQAIDGVANGHAVLGGSAACIALYHGDLAQALIALDATLAIAGKQGRRMVPLSALHRLPGATPERETNLASDELITAVHVPREHWFARSCYVKLRDRASYAFATASAAVALEIDDGVVRQARIALGGVATVPWRASAAEAVLANVRMGEDAARKAAATAFADARPIGASAYKIELGQRALVEALLRAAAMRLPA